MDNQQLTEITREALKDQNVMQVVFRTCYQYDSLIKEAFQGDYNVLPERIFPVAAADGKAVSIVEFKVERNGAGKTYSFLFTFGPEGLEVRLFRPGNSNTDLRLFGDVFPSALAMAAGRLPAGPILKDTAVTGEIKPEGWEERWQWTDKDGGAAATLITFSASPGQGVVFSIKAA